MHIPAIDPAQSLQTFSEGLGARNRDRVFGGQIHQNADTPDASALLRARSHRPWNRAAAHKCDEIPPPHACPRSAAGIVSCSATALIEGNPLRYCNTST
jgi:hypothetical protein